VDLGWCASWGGDLFALLVVDGLAVVPCDRFAAGGALDNTGHGVGLLRLGDWFGDMVPDWGLGGAHNLGDDELDILGDEFAFLPCDRLALIISSPNLLAILIRLPESDTVLFGDISAFGNHLCMRNSISGGHTLLSRKLFGNEFSLTIVHRFNSHSALGVWNNLTLRLNNISTNILRLLITLLDPRSSALLSILFHPFHDIIGRDVHAELITMKIDRTS